MRKLREANQLSQGDIEERTGLLRCYVSRVENGHTLPNLDTLEKWAHALEVEMHQLFLDGQDKPKPVSIRGMEVRDVRERRLIELFRKINKTDRQLVLHVIRDLAKRAREH